MLQIPGSKDLSCFNNGKVNKNIKTGIVSLACFDVNKTVSLSKAFIKYWWLLVSVIRLIFIPFYLQVSFPKLCRILCCIHFLFPISVGFFLYLSFHVPPRKEPKTCPMYLISVMLCCVVGFSTFWPRLACSTCVADLPAGGAALLGSPGTWNKWPGGSRGCALSDTSLLYKGGFVPSAVGFCFEGFVEALCDL